MFLFLKNIFYLGEKLKNILLVLIIFLVGCSPKTDSIKVGVLHSLTGTMAKSERPVVDATLLAIEEINSRGGILGKKIVPIVKDGKSDWTTFRKLAEELITQEKVKAVFGCWTSACRKSVLPVFEKNKSLLFYPVQYEGLENSPNIIYLGAAPNQQILPALIWGLQNLGRKVFLVGSDYVFPRAANEIIKDHLNGRKGEIVGERYLPLGGKDFSDIIDEIKKTKPDFILNSINGDSNLSFFKELREKGISSTDIPTISFSVGESELQGMEIRDVVGDFAAWNYFHTLEKNKSIQFIKNFKRKYGATRVTSDPMEAAYTGVYLWASAVEDANTFNNKYIMNSLKGRRISSARGSIRVNETNNHTSKFAMIGKIRKDRLFDVIWTSRKVIEPDPYPSSRSRGQWKLFLRKLKNKWKGKWSKPIDKEKSVEK